MMAKNARKLFRGKLQKVVELKTALVELQCLDHALVYHCYTKNEGPPVLVAQAVDSESYMRHYCTTFIMMPL